MVGKSRCGSCVLLEAAERAPITAKLINEMPAMPPWPRAFGQGEAPEVPRVPYPAPAVSSRDGEAPPFDMPGAVLKLAEKAREAGWEVQVTYARGNPAHGTTGRPTGVAHTLAVRCGGHITGRRAVAVYKRGENGKTWTADSVWMWGPNLVHCGAGGITALMTYLENPMLPDAWFAQLKADAAAKKAAARPCRLDCEIDHEHKRPSRRKAATEAL
jgi:hypothetical protein